MKASVAGWVLALALAGWGGASMAQTAAEPQVWIQIEARNTLEGAEGRVRDWATTLPDVSGFSLASGWYAVALGPYSQEEAAERLSTLRAQGVIPRDSFIADGRVYRGQFWPVGAPPAQPLAEPSPAAPVAEQPAAPAVAETAPPPPVETLEESRRAEAALSREERQDIQRALQWVGLYSAAIDGAFGAGSRAAIASWQSAQGQEATGVLSTTQREALIAGWRADLAEIGLERVRDEEAGIEVDLPMGLIRFERYTPPFAQFVAKGDSGMQVWLISQPGEQEQLYGLYDLLQSLAVMPADGPRNRRPRGFEISGRNAETEAYAWADLDRGRIRGYLVTARTLDSARTARVLQAIKASFQPFGNRVLDPGLVPLDEATRAGLLTGIEVKKPHRTGSGFFADAAGQVLTAAANVDGCARITLDAGIEADLVATDPATGAALLRPKVALAPRGHADLAADLPMVGTEVATAGFSFGLDLPLPTVTFGRFAAATALDGAADRARLTIRTMPGDVGAPVLGADGRVIGILQPPADDPTRILPEEVAFFAPAMAVTQWLDSQGTRLGTAAAAPGQMAAEDLLAIGNAMAVQVACWK